MKKLLLILLCLPMLFSSCKKEVINGCTNPMLINYNPSATQNDGSCLYESSILFYLKNGLPNGIQDPSTNPPIGFGNDLFFQIGDESYNNFGETFGPIDIAANGIFVLASDCEATHYTNTAAKKWDVAENNGELLSWRAIDKFENVYDSSIFFSSGQHNSCENIGVEINVGVVHFYLENGVGDYLHSQFVNRLYFYVRDNGLQNPLDVPSISSNSQDWILVPDVSISTSFPELIKYTHRLLSQVATNLSWKAVSASGNIYDSGNIVFASHTASFWNIKTIGIDLQ